MSTSTAVATIPPRRVPATEGFPELSRAAKARAYKAIENVHRDFYLKGGLRDTAEKLVKQRDASAQHIFDLAKFASSECRKRDDAILLFKSMCDYAEEKYKQEHDVVNLKDALPNWATYKSHILRGVRDYQLEPRQHRSVGAFRIAIQKQQQQATESVPALPNQAARMLTADELDRMLSTTIRLDSVRQQVAQVLFICENLRKGGTQKALEVLRSTADALAPFVDQRKIQ
jgi:hypothetical protein